MASNTFVITTNSQPGIGRYIAKEHYFQSWKDNNGQVLPYVGGISDNFTWLSMDDGNVGVGTRMNVSGSILPSVCNAYDLGSSTHRWRDLYLMGSTIDLGGTRLTRDESSGGLKVTSSTGALATQLASNIIASNVYVSQTLTAGNISGNGRGISQINIGNVGIGTLSVAYGGIGTNTLAANKVLVGNGTTSVLTPTNLHWDNVNARLGIGGVVNPETSLHTKGVFKLESGSGQVNAPKLYFISEYEPLPGQYWWKMVNMPLTNGNLFEADGNFSRVDHSTSYFLSVMGNNGSMQIRCEVARLLTNSISSFEIYKDTTCNVADIYLRTLDYVIASMFLKTTGTVFPVSWCNVAPVSTSNYSKVFDSGVASNCTFVKTYNKQIGIGLQPRTGYSIDAESNIAGLGFFGSGRGLSNLNVGNVGIGTLSVAFGGTGSSSLMENKVLVGNGASGLLTPTNLHWDNTNSRLGIGTSIPSAKLEVNGTIKAASVEFTSTALSSNLNADMVDGQHGSFYQNATNINAGTLSVTYGGTGTNNLSASKLLVGDGTSSVLTPTDLHWSGANLGIGSTIPTMKVDVTGSIKASSQLVSTVATGTAPFSVTSTTLVPNLNADLLDGQHGSYYQNATNINAGTLGVTYGGTGSASLTANKVLVGNGTSAVLTPSGLTWDNTNSRLGVNRSSPSDTLHVGGGVRIDTRGEYPVSIIASTTSEAGPILSILGKRYDGHGSVNFSGKLALAKNSTSMSVPSGNVLGTFAFGGNHTDGGESNVLYSSAIYGMSESTFTGSNAMASAIAFRTGAVGVPLVGYADVGTERMRITSTGNIGINNANPIAKLDVTGDIKATNITVTSTSLSSNLNADLLDGQQGSYYQNATNINTGTLAVAYGGTGANTLPSNKVLVGNGTSTVLTPTNLHWDNANSRLGLGGITAPDTTFHTKGVVRIDSGSGHSGAPKIYFVSEYQPTAGGPYWWKIANITLQNGNMFGADGSVSRVDADLSFTFNVSGINSGGNVSIYTEVSRLWASPHATFEIYRDISITPNKADIYLKTYDYVWASMRIQTHSTVLPVAWTNIAPVTTSNYYRIHDAFASSNCAMIKTHGKQFGIGIQPRAGYSIDAENNIAAMGFVGSGAGLNTLNIGNVGIGTLAVTFGGTGSSNLMANRLLIGNGTGPIAVSSNLQWTGTALEITGTVKTTNLEITSSNLIPNLHADLLDGQHGSYYQNATNINAGMLGVTYGGTGANSLTANKVLVGNASSSVLTPTDLHWTGANLGIGSTSPMTKLDVTGTIKATSLMTTSTNLASNVNADLLDGQHGSYYLDVTNVNAGTLGVTYGGTGASTLTQNKVLVGNGTGTINTPADLHWSGANLGIGSTSPQTKLDVTGTVRATSVITTSTSLASNLNADLLDGQHGTYYQNATNINAGTLGVTYGGTGSTSLTSGKLLVGNGTGAITTPTNLHWNGTSLGVGNANPATSLDVTGTVRSTAVRVVNGSSVGVEVDGGALNNIAFRALSSGAGWGSGISFENSAEGSRNYGMYAASTGDFQMVDTSANQNRIVIKNTGPIFFPYSELGIYYSIAGNTAFNAGRYWRQWVGNDNNPGGNLNYQYFNGTTLVSKGYIENDDGKAENIMNFTGQHRCTFSNISSSNHLGMIVVADGTYKGLISNVTDSNIDQITINESLPRVILSTYAYQQSCLGVVSGSLADDLTTDGKMKFGVGFVACIQPPENDPDRMYINSLGEGAIWVCNRNGNFVNGDLITSSDIPGYGMVQMNGKIIDPENGTKDDVIRNYTVGKITCDVDFNMQDLSTQFQVRTLEGGYTAVFVGCVYKAG